MNRCKCRRQISQGSLQFSEDTSAGIETVVEQSQEVRRVSLFTSLQCILHFIESVTGRVEILSGEECSFFEVIQQTLFKVSAKTRCSFLTKQTLMVEVMEYLELEIDVSMALYESDTGKPTQQELHCCVLWSKRREILIESSPLVRCRL